MDVLSERPARNARVCVCMSECLVEFKCSSRGVLEGIRNGLEMSDWRAFTYPDSWASQLFALTWKWFRVSMVCEMVNALLDGWLVTPRNRTVERGMIRPLIPPRCCAIFE